jgi:hypothetical protein
MDKKTVFAIAGLCLGVFGALVTVFGLIADHKVGQLEARMADKFALLREINDVKADVSKMHDRIDDYHVVVGPIGRPVEE